MSTKYSDEEKDRAVAIANETGSLRQASAATGISISIIRYHRQGRPPRSSRSEQAAAAARRWANETSRKVLDGLDLAVLIPDDVDEDLARVAWSELVDEIAGRP